MLEKKVRLEGGGKFIKRKVGERNREKDEVKIRKENLLKE